jgi:hypothetical protein
MNPAPEAVYQSLRSGQFVYQLAHLNPGQSYQVRLHFAEVFWTGPGMRQFNVSINGKRMLTNYDVFADAGGQLIATTKTFTVTANSHGHINIFFSNGNADMPMCSGIELLGMPGQQQGMQPQPVQP